MSSRINVVFMITSFAYGAGGALLNILRNIDSKRFSATLVYLKEHENDLLGGLPAVVESHCLGMGPGGLMPQLPALTLRAGKLFKTIEPDVVVSLLWDANILNIATSAITKHKTVLSEHTVTLEDFRLLFGPGPRLKAATFLTRKLYGRANSIVAVSRGILDYLKQLVDGRASTLLIRNPMDLKAITHLASVDTDVKPPYILYVGQLSVEKNVRMLLGALDIIKDRHNVNLVIVGDGAERGALERLASELGLRDRVVFKGYQDNPYKYMRNAEVFAFPSNVESLGMVLLEAAACGLAVVSTDCPHGPREIIDSGEDGFLVPMDDAGEMASAVSELLGDEGLREKFTANSRKKLIEYEPAAQTRKYEELILSLLDA